MLDALFHPAVAAASAPGVAAIAVVPDPAPAKMTGADVPQVPTTNEPVDVLPPNPDTPAFGAEGVFDADSPNP